jgi:alkylhydroperoxidase family enzyme
MNGGSSELLAAATTCDLQSSSLTSAQRSLLQFVQKITDDSGAISPQDVERLRVSGWSGVQIAEAIHLASLFACYNRVVNAFGLPSQGLLAVFERKQP